MTGVAAQRFDGRRADPCSLVIFGASGDLTRRLLMPTLYHLAAAGMLHEGLAVIGVAHSDLGDDGFRQRAQQGIDEFSGVEPQPETSAWLRERLHYFSGDFENPETYRKLAAKIGERGAARGGSANALFYLATPPGSFAPIIRRLGEAGLAKEESGWRRLIVEKPFGVDLASAQALNAAILGVFSEPQIYRIDHYLGKETVQNILAFRFANGLIESLWNRDRIDHVQITVAETVGVGSRGKFYDRVGALRDMVPNHMFQLLSLIAMEPPVRLDSEAVRAEKAKLLRAVQLFSPEAAMRDVVRGQYAAGAIEGRPVAAYRREPDIAAGSATETYVALRLNIDNWRWAGVPFYLRTGKALGARRTEVAVKFKEAPLTLFRDTPVDQLAENFIVLRIQPEEGIALQFNAKMPGPRLLLDGVRMDFNYRDYFDATPTTGYETLIYDCMIGDNTLFQQAEEVEAAWRIVQPVLDDWRDAPARDLAIYPAGSEGPPEADDMMAHDGRRWRPILRRPQ